MCRTGTAQLNNKIYRTVYQLYYINIILKILVTVISAKEKISIKLLEQNERQMSFEKLVG